MPRIEFSFLLGMEYSAYNLCGSGIHVKSTINEHPDLPAGMKMFAQLVVNNVIIQQTVPANVTTFYITILREAQGVRLLGFAEIAQGSNEDLAFGEEQKPFQLPLTRVNNNGPLFTLAVEFNSIAELSSRNDLAIERSVDNPRADTVPAAYPPGGTRKAAELAWPYLLGTVE
ncbi:hypothetical protein FB45DRAFT_882002 [Roridomyces roridus]|uniref:Uncharacterized protein n=1 Tax=Roridomyces roridus TaxID=1738132 RepID=A0AAD7F7Q1_9AGAR|nr:hypothetical protein FB45DRAFT_882002 [Roridomyces roridus]